MADEIETIEDEIKKGARNSKRDAERLQTIHDYAAENGAMCGEKKDVEIEINDDWLINYGSPVKSLNGIHEPDFAIMYGGEDLSADYFDKDTEYGFAGAKRKRVPILFHHAQPLETESGKRYREMRPVGEAELEIADDGVLIKEAILYNRKKYEAYLSQLGWSTGATSHAVIREAKADGRNYIKQWIIGELSITPTSAEPRIKNVVALKSLITPDADTTDKSEAKTVSTADTSAKENFEMEKEEFKALLDEQQTAIKSFVKEEAKTAAKEAVTEALEALPEVKANMNGNVQITQDPADRPFKSVAEQMFAMKGLANGRIDPRMKRIQKLSQDWMDGNDEKKALLGSNETIPSQGEFLLEPTISAEFLKPIHDDGPLSRLARRMPVGPNSTFGWINGVDETSRATGSRWGGVRGYWVGEGDSMTASQPKFKRINWELHELTVLQYATDNMLRDSVLMDSVIRQSSLEELNFKVNDAFFRGSGSGMPKGFGVASNSALISATRTNATNIDHDDILRMKMRMSPKAYSRMVWLANPDVMGELDSLTFTSGSTGILSPYVRYDNNGVMNIAGRPVVFNEFSPTLGSLGDLLLWDPQDYLYWEGAGVEGASSIHVQFLTNQTVFRFIYRCDGMPASSSAITPAQGSSTTSAYIGLAATT